MSAERSFEDIVEAQGWNDGTVANLLVDFVDNYADKARLIRYAQQQADKENGDPLTPLDHEVIVMVELDHYGPGLHRDPFTVCPHCLATNEIAELDHGIRWNAVNLQYLDDGDVSVWASLDDEPAFEGQSLICRICQRTDLVMPDGLHVEDWF